MKSYLSPPAALLLTLLAAWPALAMDKRQADASCAAWTLPCPEGAAATPGPAKKSGPLECKAKDKGRVVKEGPSVVCKDGQGQAFGDWKAGKKHGRHVTMRPDGSWLEEDFVDGKLEGRQVEYTAAGQLLKDTRFQAGKKHGLARTYGEDGRVASEELWDNGVKGKKPAPGDPAPEAGDELVQPIGDAPAGEGTGTQAQPPAP